MRRVILALVLVLVAACPAEDAPDEPAVGQEEVEDLRQRISRVSSAQRTADERLATMLSAVRELDTIVGALRDPDRVDQARGQFDRVEARFGPASSQVEQLRQPLIEMATAVDRARATLGDLREATEHDWTVRYLDAEDEVLEQLRLYAEAADGLARALITHWPTYASLHAATATFVEQRWFYRTSQEAADAYELAVTELIPRLDAAQDEIGTAIERREDAARAVNQAATRAREVWNDRPGR